MKRVLLIISVCTIFFMAGCERWFPLEEPALDTKAAGATLDAEPERAPTPDISDISPDTDSAGEAVPPVVNNGGLYVQYDGGLYYRQYRCDSFEESGLWDNFAPIPEAESSIVRLNTDGTQEALFEDYGLGSIFIYQDGSSGAQFILSELVKNEGGYLYEEIYIADTHGNSSGWIATGEVFALDMERSLLIILATYNGVFTLDLETEDMRPLASEEYEPLYYDEKDGVLYCCVMSNDEVITIASIDAESGNEAVLFSEERQIIAGHAVDSDYMGDYIDLQNAMTDDEYFYVNLVGYEGTGHYFSGAVRLKIDKDGSAYEYLEEITEPDWFGVGKPFSYQSDGPFYQDIDGYYMFEKSDSKTARLLIFHDDLASLGSPVETFGEDYFVSLRNIEYVDEKVFFTVMTGTRNEEEDIGWRSGYNRGTSFVMMKDMVTGEVRELYTY